MPVQFYARANPNASPLRVEILRRYFCKTSGIFTYIADGKNCKDSYCVNIGCVDGLEPLALEVWNIDGRSLSPIETFY